jgi:hypothetical protein
VLDDLGREAMAAVADQGHDLTLPEPASTPASVSVTIPAGALIGLGRFAERSSPARSGDGAGASKKLRILAQSVAPGSSASLVCRLHGISSGQLYA